MKKLFFLLVLFLIVSWLSCVKSEQKPDAVKGKDIFAQKVSDSFPNEKIAFPASISINQSRPKKGYYYFFHKGKKMFDSSPTANSDEKDTFDASLSDPELIKDKLIKIDYNYINTIYFNQDIRGTVTRGLLKSLALQYKTSLICVFRRVINVNAEKTIPKSYFLTPEMLISEKTIEELGAYELIIIHDGIVFDAMHDKLYYIESTENQIEFSAQISKRIDRAKQLKETAEKGLEELTIHINRLVEQIVDAFK
ncbi:MAG: hypothetical protein ACMUIP_03465 [bacterium]